MILLMDKLSSEHRLGGLKKVWKNDGIFMCNISTDGPILFVQVTKVTSHQKQLFWIPLCLTNHSHLVCSQDYVLNFFHPRVKVDSMQFDGNPRVPPQRQHPRK